MKLYELSLDRALPTHEFILFMAEILGVDYTSIVPRDSTLDAAAAWYDVTELRGEFFQHWSISTPDDGPPEMLLAQAAAHRFNVSVLISDDQVNPYTMQLVAPSGMVTPVSLLYADSNEEIRLSEPRPDSGWDQLLL